MAKTNVSKAKPKKAAPASAGRKKAIAAAAKKSAAHKKPATTAAAAKAATRGRPKGATKARIAARAAKSARSRGVKSKVTASKQQQQRPHARHITKRPSPHDDDASETDSNATASGRESDAEDTHEATASDKDEEAFLEQTQRYRQWLSFPEQAALLGQAESAVVRAWCRTLPRLAVCPASSAAFFAVATHGATPPTSPTSQQRNDNHSEDARGFPAATGDAHSMDMGSEKPLGSEHEEVYRTVRNTIAASCALGHRSCQAVWGPCGSGKHRILRLVAQECARQPNTLVLQLHGGLLNGDEDAIRSIAQQMLVFLLSPQSAALRAADWSIRTGTFDFGKLFRFDRAMEEAGLAGPSPCEDANGPLHGRGSKTKGRRRRGAHASDDTSDDDKSESTGESTEDEEEEDAYEGPFITTTTGNLVGGAASALPPLQRALLLMKHNHVNLVVCIRQAERFGLWCDQLLYILAGLMHESDGRGGGMSLLLTSAAPDLRQMEKRLSSRLTGETRFVPLLPWTPRRMLRATLGLTKELCRCHLALAEAAAVVAEDGDDDEAAAALTRPARRRRGRKDGAVGAAAADPLREKQQRVIAALTPEWQDRLASLELLLPTEVRRVWEEVLTTQVDREEGSMTSVDAVQTTPHPTLLREAMAIVCHDLQQQLTASTNKARRKQAAGVPFSGTGSTVAAAAATAATASTRPAQTLVKRIQELNEDVLGEGATAATVLAAVANCFCKTAAGTLDTLGVKARHRLIARLDRRQGRETAWPWARPTVLSATPCGQSTDTAGWLNVPPFVRQRWATVVNFAGEEADNGGGIGTAQVPGTATTTAVRSPHLPVAAPLPPHLFDLLDEGKLVELGYASREGIQILFHVLLQEEKGVHGRSIADLLEDVTSSLGTRAAAAVDREAYRAAVHQLCRLKLLRVSEDSELVHLCGSVARLREFLRTVLEHRVDWCESNVLALDAKDFMRMRSLV